jgi:uncharacterized protein YndB with AHSA1/START domain
MADTDTASAQRVIPAPPEAIFALIADPRRHKDIDGSGSVRDAKNVPAELSLGASFGMSMKLGIPYSMVSTVIEFEPNRLIAWQTRPPIGKRLAGGRIWRYELEPVDDGTGQIQTKVTETWDISQDVIKTIVRPAREHTIKSMEATLERIEALVTQK